MRRCLMAMSLVAAVASSASPAVAAPDFGPNVIVFDPSTRDVQAKVDAIFKMQEKNQFGPERTALLFKPGTYDVDLQVGFYTQVLGLGARPDEVAINGAVRATAGWMKGNATCNFWRAAENLSVMPTDDRRVNTWAVSQGAWLRRMHVRGDLHLWDGGWSSGGFLADSKVDGKVVSGSQQQWISRNDEWGEWSGGNWNMVFVGVDRPPAGEWPKHPYTVIDRTPIVREKPFLTIDDAGRYSVRVPALSTGGTRGATWTNGADEGESIPLDRFYIARADRDDAASINAALDRGQHLLLTPGQYRLSESLRVSRAETIVLGLGFPTLVPTTAAPAVRVADVDGVTIAGLILDAGPAESPTLLQVGEPGAEASHAHDPIFLYDLICRAGGATVGTCARFVTIDSNNVVGDNLWLWRADHGAGATWSANGVRHGLVVNGDDVTMYGLFVEHTQDYQTVWNGNGGRVYFYQSEMPYDPPSAEAWRPGVAGGYSAYKVGDRVTSHEAWGLGVYSYFRDATIVAARGIEAPADAAGVKLRHAVAIRLNGKPGSGIARVINDRGEPVITKMKSAVE